MALDLINHMVRKLVRRRAIRRTRRRRTVRRRLYRRRTFRRRTYRRRRYRRRYQPKTVNMKYRTVHSIGDFINLPHRLSDPAMIYYAYYSSSPATSLAKSNLLRCLNNLYSFVSTDYLSNMDKYTFPVDDMNKLNGAPNKIAFNAWNPYLDSSLLGPNYNVYASMYNYFKYRGIKVKWVPNVRTSNLIQPRMTGIAVNKTNYLYENSQSVPTQVVTTGGDSISEYRDNSRYALYANGSGQDSGLSSISNVQTHTITGNQNIPTYESFTPSYEDNFGYAPSLKMHVLFSKDDYDSEPIIASPIDGIAMISDSVYKTKPYVQNMKTQNYKIYDMSKPFKFYCRPYCASKADEVTGYEAKNDDELDQNTKLYNGDTILKKKTRLPKQVVNYQSMVNLVDPTNTAVINKWQSRIVDKNFLNPVLFGYFFTADGLEVDHWLGSIQGLVGTPDFDKCVVRYAKMLSSYGHFEITVYATFNELNNIKNN